MDRRTTASMLYNNVQVKKGKSQAPATSQSLKHTKSMVANSLFQTGELNQISECASAEQYASIQTHLKLKSVSKSQGRANKGATSNNKV
jgi:hypothetical protein